MKTLEVLEKVLAGKRVSRSRVRSYHSAFECLNKFTADWPEDVFKVNAWLAWMPKGYSDETVEHYFQTVLSGGNYIQRASGRNSDGSYKWFNVFQDAERPRIKKKHRRYFNSEQLIDCLKACEGEQEIALVSTLIDSTCRIGELVGLRGRDVHANYFICSQGKTGQRHYRLDVRICEQLKKMAVTDDGYVFKMVEGEHKGQVATVDCLGWAVRKVIRHAGITGKKVGAHTLRHSGASLVARKTQSALVVKALLQHDKIETSMLYIHDAEEEIQQGISPMEMIHVKPLEQLALTGGSSQPGDLEVVESVDLTASLFREVPEGVEVRPLLKADDLKLLRDIFIGFTRVYRGDSKVYACQDLLSRMLRKVRREKVLMCGSLSRSSEAKAVGVP